MTNRKTSIALATVMVGLLASPAFAQSTGSTSPQPQAAPESQAAPAMPGDMPMMGQGMMGPGMMGQGMGRGRMGMGQWGMGRHVEGWIAFLKTELKITPAQEKQWDAVADAMRANAQSMRGMRSQMMATAGTAATLPDRLAAREKLLSARLDGLRKYKAAVDPFYASLSDAQKKTADELMPGMMGQGMGGGMMGGGMMGRMGMR